jgi:hypothetical protein
VPLRDLADLGGWKSTKTVVSVYQQPSEDAQRRGLLALDQPLNTQAEESEATDSDNQRAQGTRAS